jgi:DNA invertase Pin-like site-specific DNA recombinase
MIIICSCFRFITSIGKHWANRNKDCNNRIPFDLSHDNLGNYVQKDILNAVNQLIDGEDQDAVYWKLLKYAFIQGIRPYELIAKKMNLSMATFYRYLNKALESLNQVLAKNNQ